MLLLSFDECVAFVSFELFAVVIFGVGRCCPCVARWLVFFGVCLCLSFWVCVVVVVLV